MRFGRLIQVTRKEKGLTLVDLANATGLSHPYLSQLESGLKANPSVKAIESLSTALGIDKAKLEALSELEAPHKQIEPLRLTLSRTLKKMEELDTLLGELQLLLQQKAQTINYVQQPMNWIWSGREEEGKIDLVLERLDKMQTKLLPVLKELNQRLELPEYPEKIEGLIKDALSLGDQGVWFLQQQVEVAKKLAEKPKS